MFRNKLNLVALGALTAGAWAGSAVPAQAASDCSFALDGTTMTMTLDADCTTDSTIGVPDGWTLDGDGHTITAVDPAGNHFRGAVVANQGAVANIRDLGVTASGLVNACDGGADRLRGILLENASGEIVGNTVVGVNQGNSGCQEGNGIEVRNAPYDGTHPDTASVTIQGNVVDDYQKTGIVTNGDVAAVISNNMVGSADLDDFIAANGIQVGFGASASVHHNEIIGNDWDGPSDYVATAVLVYAAGEVSIVNNEISGVGTDVGVLAQDSGSVKVTNNVITRSADDGKDEYGVGVWFYDNASASKAVRNTLAGWIEATVGADLDRANVVTP